MRTLLSRIDGMLNQLSLPLEKTGFEQYLVNLNNDEPEPKFDDPYFEFENATGEPAQFNAELCELLREYLGPIRPEQTSVRVRYSPAAIEMLAGDGYEIEDFNGAYFGVRTANGIFIFDSFYF